MLTTYKCPRCGKITTNSHDVVIGGKYYWTTHYCDQCDDRMDREMEFQEEGETIMETEAICPWCEAALDDMDSLSLEEGITEEFECPYCHKKFDVDVEVSRTYSTKRSLCEMPEED